MGGAGDWEALETGRRWRMGGAEKRSGQRNVVAGEMWWRLRGAGEWEDSPGGGWCLRPSP
jgi:hypothetical protein